MDICAKCLQAPGDARLRSKGFFETVVDEKRTGGGKNRRKSTVVTTTFQYHLKCYPYFKMKTKGVGERCDVTRGTIKEVHKLDSEMEIVQTWDEPPPKKEASAADSAGPKQNGKVTPEKQKTRQSSGSPADASKAASNGKGSPVAASGGKAIAASQNAQVNGKAGQCLMESSTQSIDNRESPATKSGKKKKKKKNAAKNSELEDLLSMVNSTSSNQAVGDSAQVTPPHVNSKENGDAPGAPPGFVNPIVNLPDAAAANASRLSSHEVSDSPSLDKNVRVLQVKHDMLKTKLNRISEMSAQLYYLQAINPELAPLFELSIHQDHYTKKQYHAPARPTSSNHPSSHPKKSSPPIRRGSELRDLRGPSAATTTSPVASAPPPGLAATNSSAPPGLFPKAPLDKSEMLFRRLRSIYTNKSAPAIKMRIASVRREQGVETFDMLSLEEHLKSFCNEYDADMAKKLSREQESTKHEKALLDSHDAIPIRPAMMKQSKPIRTGSIFQPLEISSASNSPSPPAITAQTSVTLTSLNDPVPLSPQPNVSPATLFKSNTPTLDMRFKRSSISNEASHGVWNTASLATALAQSNTRRKSSSSEGFKSMPVDAVETSTEPPNVLFEDTPLDDGAKLDENAECIICLEHFENGTEPTVVLGCTHKFHTKCLKKWRTIGQDNSCPMCRMITLDDEEYPNLSKPSLK